MVDGCSPAYCWEEHVVHYLYQRENGRKYTWREVSYMITHDQSYLTPEMVLSSHKSVEISKQGVYCDPLPYSLCTIEEELHAAVDPEHEFEILNLNLPSPLPAAEEFNLQDVGIDSIYDLDKEEEKFSIIGGTARAFSVASSIEVLDQTVMPYALSSLTQAQMDFVQYGPSVPLVYGASFQQGGGIQDDYGDIEFPPISWSIDHWETEEEIPQHLRCQKRKFQERCSYGRQSLKAYYICTCVEIQYWKYKDTAFGIVSRPLSCEKIRLDLDVLIVPTTTQRISYYSPVKIPAAQRLLLSYTAIDTAARLISPDVYPWTDSKKVYSACPLYFPIFPLDPSGRYCDIPFRLDPVLSQIPVPFLTFSLSWNKIYSEMMVTVGNSAPALVFFPIDILCCLPNSEIFSDILFYFLKDYLFQMRMIPKKGLTDQNPMIEMNMDGDPIWIRDEGEPGPPVQMEIDDIVVHMIEDRLGGRLPFILDP